MTAPNPQMRQLFVQWARSKNLKRPDNPEQLKAMQAQFVAELNQKMGTAIQSIGAAGDGTYNRDPISQMRTRPMQLLRNSGGMIDVTEVEHEDSDFTDLVRARNQAMQEADGDDLAAEVIHRQDTHAALSEQAPFQRNNPVSVLQGNIGGTGIIKTDGLPVSLAYWAGDDPETLPVTVTFAPLFPTDINFNIGFLSRPYGIVQFGTKAYLFSVEVDIGRGVQFTISGSSVSIQAALDISGSLVPSNGTGSLTVAGMLSFHPIAKALSATRTLYLDAISGSGSQKTSTGVNIPYFARNVTIWRSDPTIAVELFFQNTINGTPAYRYSIAANAFNLDPIPISGDVNLLNVSPNGGPLNIEVVYGLSF